MADSGWSISDIPSTATPQASGGWSVSNITPVDNTPRLADGTPISHYILPHLQSGELKIDSDGNLFDKDGNPVNEERWLAQHDFKAFQNFHGDQNRALFEGLTFGASDHIEALLEGGKYSENLDRIRQERDQFAAEHPYAAAIPNLVGGAIPALLTGGETAAATGTNALTRFGIGAATSSGVGMGMGGAQGFLNNVGGTKDTAAGAAKATVEQGAEGAVLGGTLHTVGEAAARTLGLVGDGASAFGRLLQRYWQPGTSDPREVAEMLGKSIQTYADNKGIPYSQAVQEYEQNAQNGKDMLAINNPYAVEQLAEASKRSAAVQGMTQQAIDDAGNARTDLLSTVQGIRGPETFDSSEQGLKSDQKGIGKNWNDFKNQPAFNIRTPEFQAVWNENITQAAVKDANKSLPRNQQIMGGDFNALGHPIHPEVMAGMPPAMLGSTSPIQMELTPTQFDAIQKSLMDMKESAFKAGNNNYAYAVKDIHDQWVNMPETTGVLDGYPELRAAYAEAGAPLRALQQARTIPLNNAAQADARMDALNKVGPTQVSSAQPFGQRALTNPVYQTDPALQASIARNSRLGFLTKLEDELGRSGQDATVLNRVSSPEAQRVMGRMLPNDPDVLDAVREAAARFQAGRALDRALPPDRTPFNATDRPFSAIPEQMLMRGHFWFPVHTVAAATLGHVGAGATLSAHAGRMAIRNLASPMTSSRAEMLARVMMDKGGPEARDIISRLTDTRAANAGANAASRTELASTLARILAGAGRAGLGLQ
jgi:hypothetical protein